MDRRNEINGITYTVIGNVVYLDIGVPGPRDFEYDEYLRNRGLEESSSYGEEEYCSIED